MSLIAITQYLLDPSASVRAYNFQVVIHFLNDACVLVSHFDFGKDIVLLRIVLRKATKGVYCN